MSPNLPMPETPSASSHSIASTPRVLRREWNLVKPYLPKSTSLPAFQLPPKDRPRYICCKCGFVNFYNIPLCVWCGCASESAVRAFESESTMSRTRTASAPPRVFWAPNELSVRAPRFSETEKIIRDPAFATVRDADDFCDNPTSQRRREHNCALISAGTSISHTRHSMMVLPPSSRPGRSQTHKRSHSEPNAHRIGHPTRPYYSVIRRGTLYCTNLDARQSVALRPASLALLPPTGFPACSISASEDEEAAAAFKFVTPAAGPHEARTAKRTLSARISRGLSSPVSAMQAINRAAEMRGELAALVRQSGAMRDESRNHDAHGVFAGLRKFRRLKGLVRRTTHAESVD
ncbi:hypothetical protein B0H19DRAFT_1252868 [Mycena capillaripes]|nr:hypothetical protein B0H19DRAFT_1252868 [Mycena capillaripes]